MRYKIGDLVELVTEKNSDLKYGLADIVGVTLEKQMIPTIANLTQTDLADFIIVSPGNFIYNPRTHGKKIGLGFNTTNRCFISTWNNNTFRVKPHMENTVLPGFLYLHFLRERWDKEACFHAWGSSTVVLLWSSFCEMGIDVPPIEEQRKIVHDYQVITDRIALLRKMNENLEEQAQIILNNALTNNSVAIMPLGEIADFIDGDRGKNYPTFNDFTLNGYCLFLSAANVTSTGFEFENCVFVTKEKDKAMNKGHLSRSDIVITSRGTVGNVAFYDKHVPHENIRINSGMLIVRPKAKHISPYFLHALLKSRYMKVAIEQFKSGSAQPQLPIKDLQKIKFLVPCDTLELQKLDTHLKVIQESISLYNSELDLLKNLKADIISIMNIQKNAT